VNRQKKEREREREREREIEKDEISAFGRCPTPTGPRCVALTGKRASRRAFDVRGVVESAPRWKSVESIE
jgi:hypothetical protein